MFNADELFAIFGLYRSNDLTKASVRIREEIRAVNVRNVILISRSTHISQLLRQNDDGGKSDNNLNWIVSRPESTIDLDANLGKGMLYNNAILMKTVTSFSAFDIEM